MENKNSKITEKIDQLISENQEIFENRDFDAMLVISLKFITDYLPGANDEKINHFKSILSRNIGFFQEKDLKIKKIQDTLKKEMEEILTNHRSN